MGDERVITYETLYDILRKEKSSNEIQDLDEGFLQDVLAYLNDKKSLATANPSSTLFSPEEQQRTQQQLENAKRLLRDIYEWREKKIMLLARDASRSRSLIVNKAAMLSSERAIFDEIFLVLNRYRQEILYPLLAGQGFHPISSSPSVLLPKDLKNESRSSEEETYENPLKSGHPSLGSIIRIKVLKEVSAFVTPDLQTRGPYEVGELVELPELVAGILINRKQGERVD